MTEHGTARDTWSGESRAAKPWESATRWGAGRIATAYAVAAMAWILGSGALVARASAPDAGEFLELGKGMAFVLVTSGLLYALLRRHFERLTDTYRALEKSEVRFEEVFESVPVLVWTANADGHIDFVNRRATSYLGGGQLAAARDWRELVHPEDREQLDLAQKATADEAAQILVRIRGETGEFRWFESRTVSIRAGQEVVRWYGTLADVHEAVEARLALKREEERLARIANTIPPGMMLYSFRLWRDGRMTFPYVSAGIVDLYGLQPGEVRDDASRIVGLTHPDDLMALTQAVNASARTLTPWHQQFRIRHPLRGDRWVEARSMPAREDENGTTIWHGVMTDVTERREMEDALRQTQARLLAALEGGGIGTWIWEDGSEGVRIDAGLARLWGLPPDETFLPLSTVLAAIHADDAKAARSEVAATLRGERDDIALTYRVNRVDGVHWMSITGHVERGADGRAVRIVGAAVDVTGYRQVQEQLRASEDRFSKAFHLSPLAQVVARKRDRVIVEANDAYLRLMGYSREEVIGSDSEALSLAMDPSGVGTTWDEIYADKAARGQLYRFQRRDGSEGAALASIESLEIGGETHLLAVMNDITERLAAEEALRRSEERFRELAEAIREVFWLSEPGDARVLYVSPAYEAIWGVSVEALYATPSQWMEMVHEEDRERVRAAFLSAAAGKYDEEYRVVRPDGTVRWIRDRAFPVRNADGEVVRIAGVAEDITERRELEEQVRQTQKMESIGELAGGVAHDFNNWLTVIQSYSDLLMDDLPRGSEAHEFVTEIQAAGARAASLTRQLLAFSRREIVERRVVDLNGIVLDTEKMLRRLLGEDVEMHTNLTSGLPVLLFDPGQLVQVLVNLAVNARDAMPRGGTLLVETLEAVAPPDARPGQRWIALHVSDTGVGMPPDVASRIFEPFFTTKEVGKGTGLGLSVVHGIVEQSGGRISVDSEPGRGTTFRVAFPAISEAEGAGAKPTGLAARLVGTETILLAEDEESIRRLVTLGLRRNGYTVLAAADGQEALEILMEHAQEIDLLVTDVVMPRLSGQALADEVRQHAPGVRILFSSGYTDDAVLRHGVMHADVAFLQKPYTVDTLLLKIRKTLDAPR